jgi:hypothetical protein
MAENAMKSGHNTGTEPPEDIQKAGDARTAKDHKSVAPAFTPRLLNLAAAGHYLGISPWSVRELVWAGWLPVVKIPRTDGTGDMNRVLIDRNDLDAFIAGLPREYES